MSTSERDEEVAHVEHELRRLVKMGFLQYYAPSVPAGEQYVFGVEGTIVKLNHAEVHAFLVGTTVVAAGIARQQGLLPEGAEEEPYDHSRAKENARGGGYIWPTRLWGRDPS